MDVTFALALLVLCTAGSIVLLVAGTRHAAGYHSLVDLLRRQRLLPAAPAVAGALVAAELTVGAGAIALFVLAGSTIGFVAQAMLYAAFAGYLTVLIAARPGTECGCWVADGGPARPWEVALGTAMAAASLGATLAGLGTSVEPLATRLLVAVGAAGMVAAATLLVQAWRPALRPTLQPALRAKSGSV